MAKIKGISKGIDDMSYEEIKNLAKTQRLKQKSRRGKGMSKKNVCIHCGAEAESACEVCATRDKNGEIIKNNICFTHTIYFDMGMTLNQRSLLKLSAYKDHPQFFACLSDKGTGCAVSVVKAIFEALGKKVKTKKATK